MIAQGYKARWWRQSSCLVVALTPPMAQHEIVKAAWDFRICLHSSVSLCRNEMPFAFQSHNMATFICVEPLLPTYSTLHRLDTLTLLISALIIMGIMGYQRSPRSFMARKAVVAFYAVALLATLIPSRNVDTKVPLAILPAFDLDIIGAWTILSAIGVAIPILLGRSPALRHSKARFLVKIWGCLIAIRGVCALAAMRKSAAARMEYVQSRRFQRKRVGA